MGTVLSYRPDVDVLSQHLAQLDGEVAANPWARVTQDASALLLVGLEDPEVDRRLAIYAAQLPARRAPGGSAPSREALEEALARRGLERVCGLVEELRDLRPLAWFEPPAREEAALVARLTDFRAAMEPSTGGMPVLTATIADAAARFAPDQAQALLRGLAPGCWIERTAIGTALGYSPASAWARRPVPAWVPRGHPVELRDPLTGLLRRQMLAGASWKEPYRGLNVADRIGPGGGVVYIDVDHMKRTLDTYSLPAGDRVLRAIADRVQSLVGDRVVRFGGDELLILWEDTDVRELGRRLVDELGRLTVTNPFGAGERIPVSVSAGTAFDEDLGAALRRADRALELAKSSGRGRAEHGGG